MSVRVAVPVAVHTPGGYGIRAGRGPPTRPSACNDKSGAKGTRTPDPHTASVVRYQLRHSPVKLCPSKLHHLR